LSNLTVRLLTAAVAVPFLLLAIWWSEPWGVYALVSVACMMSMGEFGKMTGGAGFYAAGATRPPLISDRGERALVLVLGALVTQAIWWQKWLPGLGLAILPFAVLAPAVLFLFRFVDISTVARRWAFAVTGIVYAGVLFMYLALIKRDFGADGGKLVLLTLMIAWFGDTGAYFAGRFLGKTKLYPAVSPAKTRAGAVGGLGGSFLGAVLANLWFMPHLGWVNGAILTIVGGALGQTGDLVESLLKRSVGVKDSGKSIPGHGGMLDRIDAVLFIAPWVYCYMQLFGR
jgi:phosphatidate cytidylyltransferase